MCSARDPNSPALRLAFVCYADILGFRDSTERAFKSGKENEFLQKTKRSLGAAYENVRRIAKRFEAIPLTLDMKVFTDNIVVAHPLSFPSQDLGEPELGSMLDIFAHLQAGLAADGFFLRGAITIGPHYQDKDVVYGTALLEAVDLDKSGKPPRLVIGQSVEPLISEHLSWYFGGWTPHHPRLLEDPRDGRLFINYLNVAFENFPDGPIDYELLARHRKSVRRGLREHESNERVLPKYRWLAYYHDYVCRTFADAHSIRNNEKAEPFDLAVEVEAQKVLDHLIPFEEQLFRPLDSGRLPQLATLTNDIDPKSAN